MRTAKHFDRQCTWHRELHSQFLCHHRQAFPLASSALAFP